LQIISINKVRDISPQRYRFLISYALWEAPWPSESETSPLPVLGLSGVSAPVNAGKTQDNLAVVLDKPGWRRQEMFTAPIKQRHYLVLSLNIQVQWKGLIFCTAIRISAVWYGCSTALSCSYWFYYFIYFILFMFKFLTPV
jgi:hypothetical protein